MTDEDSISGGIVRVLYLALGRDLSHGEFRARETRRHLHTAAPHAGTSTAQKLASTQREFGELRSALRNDLTNGDFRGALHHHPVLGAMMMLL